MYKPITSRTFIAKLHTQLFFVALTSFLEEMPVAPHALGAAVSAGCSFTSFRGEIPVAPHALGAAVPAGC